MSKFLAAIILFLLIGTQYVYCQSSNSKIPTIAGNINDWEGLFTDAQKAQLDSISVIFAYKTNIPISVVTFGATNTTKEGTDAFVAQVDSLLFQNNESRADMAIFLSKDFRVLNFQNHTPATSDTSKLGEWKAKMQQIFTSSVQPYIPLLKDGKYAEALLATISDLAVAVKKEM
jgi:hypothetical protein